MEFKGTKGKWEIEPNASKNAWIGNKNNWSALACGNSEDEAKANALLISKAPEMLEMLKHVLALAECGNIVEAYKVEKIIKEATELNI